MLLDIAILATVVMAGLAMWSRRVLSSTMWRAAITPLASIIGSGFLVLGPILQHAYGVLAPLVMAALCLAAWVFGAAIRHNIAARADGTSAPASERLEHLASALLGFAYAISVAYYLNLFGAFSVSLVPGVPEYSARLITTAVFAVILGVGWSWGFKMLENMEYVSVTLKLAIIAGLLVGLAAYFVDRAAAGELYFDPPRMTGWAALTLGFGLIVTVQGFETSRYLGESYDATTRIRSMRFAQIVSTGIYMLYIVLLAYVFRHDQIELTETSIIDMMRVAPILPLILVAAALAAQFSAAVADTSGGGGLISEFSRGLLSVRASYALLVAIGLLLTWTANVFEIISYASRAFAGYYAVQAAIAALNARAAAGGGLRAPMFWALAALGAVIALFGAPVEG